VAGMRNKEVWVNERRGEEDIDGIVEEECGFCMEEQRELSVIAPGKRAPDQCPDDPETLPHSEGA
jgi:hypothetical protein